MKFTKHATTARQSATQSKNMLYVCVITTQTGTQNSRSLIVLTYCELEIGVHLKFLAFG